MSTTYDGSDDWTTSITIPSDGDTRDAASVNVALQALADRSAHLRNAAYLIGERLQPLTEIHNASSRFAFQVAASATGWRQTDVTDAGGLWIPVTRFLESTVDTGVLLTGITAHVNGGGASHGALPATMPTIKLHSLATDGTTAEVATATDSSATVGAYEADHTIAITGETEAINNAKNYFVELEGEASTNSLANALWLYAITATFSIGVPA